MRKDAYVYKIKEEDLPWIKEAVLAVNKGDIFEYTWAEAYKEEMYIILHEIGFIEATARPYWEVCMCLNNAEEFKEKLYERMLTA